MKRKISRFAIPSALMFAVLMFEVTADAQHEQVFPFSGNNGLFPASELIADSSGNLYGTTLGGGSFGFGVVFEFTPPQVPGGQWSESTLYSFKGAPDGSGPNANLILDGAGNLYGTTQSGGTCGNLGCGTIFQVSPPSQPGGLWTESLIHDFPETLVTVKAQWPV